MIPFRGKLNKAGTALALHTLGTASTPEVRQIFEAAARDHLGMKRPQAVSYYASYGFSVVIQDNNGERAFAKLLLPVLRYEYLKRLRRLQADLHRQGLPAARPLTPPIPCGPGHLVFDEFLQPARGVRKVNRHVTEVLAEGLAAFVGAAASHRHVDLGKPAAGGYVNPRFDLTGLDAPLLDELSHLADSSVARAKASLATSHTDWRVDNIVVSGGRVAAIYDFDAVARVPELAALGNAAVLHTVSWHPYRAPASPKRARHFLDVYQRAQGSALTDGQRSAAMGYGLKTLIEAARNQLSQARTAKDEQRLAQQLIRVGRRYLD